MDDLTRDTARSYFWNQLAVVLDGGTITLAYFAVGRLSGAARLGEFGWMLSTAGLVVLASGLGLRESSAILVQRAAHDDALLAGLLRKCLRVRAVGAVCAGLAMGGLLLVNTGSAALAAAACAYVVAILLANFIATFDLALFRARAVAAGKLASSLVALSLVVAGAVWDSTTVIFSGLALGAAAGIIFYVVPLRTLLRAPSERYPFRDLMALSWTLWLASFFNYIVNMQGVQAVMKLARVESQLIGFFTAGLAIAMVANRLLIGGFANVILAAFSRAQAGGQGRLAELYSLYVRVSAVLTLPILFGALVFADELAKLPLKENTHEAALVIRILAGAFIAARLLGGGAHSAALFASGAHVAALVIRAVFAVVMFAATWTAASFGGIAHVAVAAGAVSMAVVAAEGVYLMTRRGITLPFAPLARLALGCGLGAVPAWIVVAQGGLSSTAAGLGLFAVSELAALSLARPLEAGEVDRIGVKGPLAGILRHFEAAAAGDAGCMS